MIKTVFPFIHTPTDFQVWCLDFDYRVGVNICYSGVQNITIFWRNAIVLAKKFVSPHFNLSPGYYVSIF